MRLGVLIVSATLALAGAAHAQTTAPQPVMPQRIAGTVKSLSSDQLVLGTDKGEVRLPITPQTRVLASETASATEIAPGSYLGTANVTTADGGEATEVHLMASGPNVHTPMDDAGMMMTNGRVKSVTTTSRGREMDIDYGAGSRHVVVPAQAPVTRMVASDLASLKTGTAVTAIVRPDADGKPSVTAITLTPAKP